MKKNGFLYKLVCIDDEYLLNIIGIFNILSVTYLAKVVL